jgi:hypothetical protein
MLKCLFQFIAKQITYLKNIENTYMLGCFFHFSIAKQIAQSKANTC